jgi:hypothetical protein
MPVRGLCIVAWLWRNRIKIVIWLAAAIINVADTLMGVFCENNAWTYSKRELSMFIRLGMRNQTIYKSKDILILIVWTSIGTLGIYLQNGIVFRNDFLSMSISTYSLYMYVETTAYKFRIYSMILTMKE